jgi:hypothetical protein
MTFTVVVMQLPGFGLKCFEGLEIHHRFKAGKNSLAVFQLESLFRKIPLPSGKGFANYLADMEIAGPDSLSFLCSVLPGGVLCGFR